MPTTNRPCGIRLAFVILAILAVAVVVTGCGRRGSGLADGGTPTAAPITQPVATATLEPTPSASPTATAAAPLQTPDLSAVESLLSQVDNALAADATADDNEGSPK